MSKDPFKILDISRDADEEEIRVAYRDKIKEAHPDVGGSEEEFKKIHEAYQHALEGEINDSRLQKDRVQQQTKDIFPVEVEYINYTVIKDLDDLSNPFSQINLQNLSEEEYGKFKVHSKETVLEAAERVGYKWPFSCRGGACANCAVQLIEGEILTPNYFILDEELLSKGYRLSCLGKPLTSKLKLVYNVKNKEELEHLLLPSQAD